MSFGIAPADGDGPEDDPSLTETDPNELGGSDELPPEVTCADLTKYPLAELNGRIAHYTREKLFERKAALRAAYQIEIERTVIELNRRGMYARAEAERVFKL